MDITMDERKEEKMDLEMVVKLVAMLA